MIDTYVKKFNLPWPASYVTDSKLLDGVWIMNNIIPYKVLIVPKKFSIGDHRVIPVDLNFDQVIERGRRIYILSIRRLICENERSVKNYNHIA